VYAEMEAMQAAGMSPMEVLVASTRTAALALGAAGRDLGTVEVGKVADLVVAAADPTADIAGMRKVRFVARGGVVRPVAALAAMAQ
jgi:imidazolonepropionase-like amidohydrolase